MPTTKTFKTAVSDLCLCQRCPRLLDKKLSGETNAWKVGLKGSSFCGTIFHTKIAAPFHQDAAKQSSLKKRREIIDLFVNNVNNPSAIREAFFNYVKRNYLFPYLKEHSETLYIEQIASLNQIVERWGNFLIDFFLDNPGFREDPEKFTKYAFSLPPERTVRAKYTAADGTVLDIGGRFDSALLDITNGEVLLLEYKCRKETAPIEELAQLALYAWLIHEKTGLKPRTCVLYLEEEYPAAHFSVETTGSVVKQLSSLFNCTIQVLRAFPSDKGSISKTDNPHLCQECPYNKGCAE